MSGDLSEMLNRSTPFAPTTEEEISRRLEASNNGQQERALEFPPQAVPETKAEHELHDRTDSSEWDIFVPVRERPHRLDGPVVVEYEIRELGSGQGAVPIYTTPESLRNALGQSQPMVKVDVIEFLHQVQGRVPVVVNPTLQEGVTRRQVEELD